MAGRPARHVNFLAALPLLMVRLVAANPNVSFNLRRPAEMPAIMPSRISSARSVIETFPTRCPATAAPAAARMPDPGPHADAPRPDGACSRRLRWGPMPAARAAAHALGQSREM